MSIVEILKAENIRLPLNMNACYTLLSYDQMLGQETLLSGVKRYLPATIATINRGRSTEREYFRFSNASDTNLSEADHIERT